MMRGPKIFGMVLIRRATAINSDGSVDSRAECVIFQPCSVVAAFKILPFPGKSIAITATENLAVRIHVR
jgi:hypothetical protein